MEKKEKDIY